MENKKQSTKKTGSLGFILNGLVKIWLHGIHNILAVVIFLGYFIPYVIAVVGFFQSTDISDIPERIQAFLVLTRDMAVPIFILTSVILVLRAFVKPKLQKQYEEFTEKLEEYDIELEKEIEELEQKKMENKAKKDLEKRFTKMTPQEKEEYYKQKQDEKENIRLAKLAWEAEQKRQTQKNCQ